VEHLGRTRYYIDGHEDKYYNLNLQEHLTTPAEHHSTDVRIYRDKTTTTEHDLSTPYMVKS
jgi:hypothetical protein